MANISKNPNISRSGRRVSHRSTWTQRNSFKATNRSGKRVTQAGRVLEYLAASGPASSRQISDALQIERTAICRCLKDLEDGGKIAITDIEQCQITGRPVQLYSLAPAKQAGRATQKSLFTGFESSQF